MKQKKGRKKGGGGGNWDQVPIGEEFLAQQEMDNLISLEVLTDYQIVKRPDGLTQIVTAADREKKKGQTKRKFDNDDEEDDDDDEDFEDFEDEEMDEEPDDDGGGSDDSEIPVKSPKKKLKLETTSKKEKKKVKPKEKVKETPKKYNEDSEVSSTSSWVIDNKPTAPPFDPSTTTNKNKNTKNSNKKDKAEKKPKVKAPPPQKEEKEVATDAEVSMAEWIKAGVQEPVLQALKESGFHKPTAIQSLTLPASILGQKDIVGAAETGSGKTLAFAIPIIQGILHNREIEGPNRQNPLKALILTPTRELAVQIKKHFDAAAKHARIKTVVIVGGLASQKQERLLRGQPEVVIATPGRLWELCKEGDEHLATINQIRYLAVDETDRMVEKGHFQELEGILGLLNKEEELQTRRQNFVFSATLAFTHDPPKRLNTKKFKAKTPKKVSPKEKLRQIMEMIGVRSNPKIVDITSSKGTCETLQEMQINCSANKKDYYMYYFLIKHPGRTIVFCNSINTVRRLTNLFFLLKCAQVLPLHSEMHQKMRLKNLEKFAEDDKSVLIATDVAARGLDIVDIQHVVHYEIPKTAESYIHRSGRTARAFKGGIAVVLVEPSEIGQLKNIFRSLNRDPDKMLPLFSVDGGVFKQLKPRVDEADKVETFEHTVRKKLADMNWMDKAKKEMDIESSEDDSGMDEDSGTGEQRKRRNLMQAKKKLDHYKKTLSKLLEDNSVLSKLLVGSASSNQS